ncbi:MAG: endonuclease/exonuclease/phosphatase family protein [Chloroflexota bacterium]|nr:endonuclease/exonuclease/phosphatase family protein [Chloroflexota bacterium]
MRSSNARLTRFALIALSAICLLQTIRAIFPLAIFQPGLWYDTTSEIMVAAHLFTLFAVGFVAPVLARLFGWRGALLFAGGGLAFARLAMQFAPNEGIMLLLASAAIASAWLLLPLALQHFASEETIWFPLAVITGFIIDSALNAAFFTWDYVWQPGLAGTGVAFVIAIALLVALHFSTRTTPAQPSAFQWGAYLLLAPFFALHITFLTNTAFVAALTGLNVPAASALVLLSSAAVIAASLLTLRLRLPLPARLVAGVALAAALFFIRTATGLPGALLIVVGHMAAGVLLVRAFASPIRTTARFAGITIASGAAGLLFISFAVGVNYASSFVQLPVIVTAMPAAAVLLLALLAPADTSVSAARPSMRWALLPITLLVIPIVLALTQPAMQPPRTDMTTLRAMTYNIHQSADNEGFVGLEAIAQTIEAANLDVVMLQEVSRGPFVNGSPDSVEWLSRRLRMPYRFFAGDGQMGNAILTRLSIVESDFGLLPRNDEFTNRSYVRVVVDVGNGETLTVINTHLDHMQRANRLPQVESILALWDNAPRTLIGGDLNAQPGSDEIVMLESAGLVSGQDVTGNGGLNTFIAFEPFWRLDYIFGSPDIRFVSSAVPSSLASDHLPVVVEITLPLNAG